MHVIPRVRLQLARRPWLYWSFVALCAFAVWSGVTGATSSAAAERDRWGSTRTVLVATGTVHAGQPIRAAPRRYPLAMVPGSAVVSLPVAAVAAHTIEAGEVIVTASVAGEHEVPVDWVVFAVGGNDRPALVAGDVVAVFGDGARWCDGTVTAIADDHTDIAVPPSCADAVSAQVDAEAVVLARAGTH
ncbi:MAG: hypothetical protein WCK21_00600 [Actinomycetota bacterium]